jgi:hypothetical protein
VEVGVPGEALGIAPPLQTIISGQVEGVSGAVEQVPAIVSLVDASGKTVVQSPLKEDGTFSIPVFLRQEQSGFFKIVIERAGKIDFESAISIEAGKNIAAGQLKLNPVTTLALFLGETYNASPKRALERAVSFYGPILKSLDPALVEAALLELQNPVQDFGTFTGGTNAFRRILDEIFSRLKSDSSL